MTLTPVGACPCTWAGEPTSLILPSSISTAAGESRLPVRGSSSRPAFTGVIGEGTWAARSPIENRTKNNGANSTNRLHILIRSPTDYFLARKQQAVRSEEH